MSDRDEFEAQFRIPRGVMLNDDTGKYEACEPYIWCSDSAANALNNQWAAWQAAVRAEREMCARVCEGLVMDGAPMGASLDHNDAVNYCAKAIRARK